MPNAGGAIPFKHGTNDTLPRLVVVHYVWRQLSRNAVLEFGAKQVVLVWSEDALFVLG